MQVDTNKMEDGHMDGSQLTAQDSRKEGAQVGQRVELHCRSVYSVGDGVSNVKDIFDCAKFNGMTAVAITDHNTVRGYGEAENLSNLKGGIRAIYGMEADVVNELQPDEDEKHKKDSRPFQVTFLIRDEEAIKNLYTLKNLSEKRHDAGSPRMLWREIEEYREGLLVGSSCEYGELYLAILKGEDDVTLEAIARKYDYIEIQPAENMLCFIDENEMSHEEALAYLRNCDRKMIEIADRVGKLVVATSNVHFVTAGESVVRSVLQRHLGHEDDGQANTYFKTTQELLDDFSFLGEEKAWEIVVENTNKIAEMIEWIMLISSEGDNYPKLDSASSRLRDICYKRLHEMYPNDIPREYLDRLEQELQSLSKIGSDSILLLLKELIEKSGYSQYEMGYRGHLGGLLTAYLCGVTCVNPLDSLLMLYSEFAIGLEGKKCLDINLTFPSEAKHALFDFCGELEGIREAVREGVYSTLSLDEVEEAIAEYEKYHEVNFTDDKREWIEDRLWNVRKKHGMHPAAILLIPENHEVNEFAPLTRSSSNGMLVTDIPHHHCLDNLCRINIFTNTNLYLLHLLAKETGVQLENIPLDATEVLPTINGKWDTFVAEIIKIEEQTFKEIAQAINLESFVDVVHLLGLVHGTDVWEDNMEELICLEGFTKDDIISSREDVYEYLLALGFTREDAFRITEYVRMGRAVKDNATWIKYKDRILAAGGAEWFVEACEKIIYMFPRAHVYIQALHIWRLIWFKIHFPLEFEWAYSKIK